MFKTKFQEFISILAIACLLILATYFQIFLELDNWGINDWDPAITWYSIITDSIVQFKELPLWSPYVEGGRPFYLYPEHIFYYPLYYLVFPWFKIVHAFKFFFLLHILIAFLTSYYFAKSCKLSPAISIFVAILYTFNSSVSLSFAIAHVFYFGYSWLPLFLMGIMNTRKTAHAIALCTFGASMLILSSSTYIALIAFLFTGLFSVIIFLRGHKRSLEVLSISLLITFLLTMFKTIPEVFFMNDVPRMIEKVTGHSISSLIYSFIGREQNIFWEHDSFSFLTHLKQLPFLENKLPLWLYGISDEWPDNGVYLGVIPVALSLYAAFKIRKKYWILTTLLLIFVWTSFGTRTMFGPWTLLKNLPLFESMRSLMRFKIIAIPFICLFSGIGLHLIKKYIKGKYINLLISVLTIIIFLDMTETNHRVVSNAYPFKAINVQREVEIPSLVHAISNKDYGNYSQTSDTAMYPRYLKGYSIQEKISDRTNRRVIHSQTQDSKYYRGEYFLLNSSGNLKIKKWSPNKMSFTYDVKGNDKIIVNQNFDKDWTIRKKGQVDQYRGVIAIPVSGKGEVEIVYSPKGLYIVSLLSLISGICIFFAFKTSCAKRFLNSRDTEQRYLTV